jgi:hypothetical protein
VSKVQVVRDWAPDEYKLVVDDQVIATLDFHGVTIFFRGRQSLKASIIKAIESVEVDDGVQET